MKNLVRFTAAPALLTLAMLGNSAWAQTAAPSAAASSPAMTAAPSMTAHNAKRQGFVEQRLRELHSQLKITSAESSQWDAFAQSMRDSADKTGQAYKDRAEKASTQTADEAMKSYADLAQLHADNTKNLAASFSTLYASLSDTQKKNADVLFREHQAQHRAAMHRQKRAAAKADAPAAASN